MKITYRYLVKYHDQQQMLKYLMRIALVQQVNHQLLMAYREPLTFLFTYFQKKFS